MTSSLGTIATVSYQMYVKMCLRDILLKTAGADKKSSEKNSRKTLRYLLYCQIFRMEITTGMCCTKKKKQTKWSKNVVTKLP